MIALIIGVTGQDGAYLSKHLLQKGYKVYGTARRSSTDSYFRLDYLGISKDVEIIDFDLLESSNIQRTIKNIKPDEIYNLGAQSFVPTSFELPILTTDINALGVVRILDSILNIDKSIKFYQASTSEMFGKVTSTPQNELTRFYPRSPYAVSKVFSHYITVNYRESYDLFACSGILFNHESPLRGEEFVTKKIARSLAQIKKGQLKQMLIGNVDVKRDWGYAGDYVDAMWRMLNAKTAKDYVISSEKTHSVREFIDKTTDFLGMKCEWQGEGIDTKLIDKSSSQIIVKVDKTFFRPAEVDLLLGDSSLAKEDLKWEPTISFEQLIEMMVEYELEKIK
jgi:GDPmannose 4,6-dehydratase|tara:strand:+ start:521 stop:1531 length:1011 start_codon:yes stop_codon:yes gene_type:complete